MPNGLLIDVKERIAYLTLNRPKVRNAIDSMLQRELVEAIEQLGTDSSIWLLYLTGAGDKAFSAGVDLKELATDPAHSHVGANRTMRPLFEAVLDCPKPVIAVLNGSTIGGGCELALCCDLRIAADNVKIGMPEVKLGLGGAVGAQLLCRLAPLGVAKEMLYFGDTITAQEALRHGIVNRVVPRESLRAAGEAYARQLLRSAPLSVQRHKRAIRSGLELPLAVAIRMSIQPDPYTSEDRSEGVRAFAEGRDPVWQGR